MLNGEVAVLGIAALGVVCLLMIQPGGSSREEDRLLDSKFEDSRQTALRSIQYNPSKEVRK